MKTFVRISIVGLAFVVAAGVLAAQQGTATSAPPPWAYGFTAPPPPPGTPPPAAAPAAPAAQAPPDESLKHLDGTTAAFTLAQIRDAFGPADWYPGDHPTMPDIVAHGKKPDARACGLCHYPNGKGRAENAGVSGLPPSYFLQQLADFRGDVRKSADARKANTNIMTQIAKAMTDDEMKAAAQYFAAIPWTPWIKVVETNTVPKTRIQGGLFLKLEGNETEPIGQRIIEVPDNTEHTELLRDPRSGFTAYAPVGAIKKGETLVTTGGAGKTTQCAVCHGADLQGLGPVPGLAGRSPSYIVRQLYDMQQGTRHGIWTDLMKPVVAKLTPEDMLNISAYTASRVPRPDARQSAQ